MAFDFPATPTVGQVYTLNGVTYVWNGYAWMQASPSPGLPLTDVPIDGKTYARKDAAWSELAFRGARCRRTSALAIGSATMTTMGYEVAEFDTSGFFGGGSTFTIPANVKYVELYGQVYWTVNNAGSRYVDFIKNAATIPSTVRQQAIESSEQQNSSGPLAVVQGDAFVMRVYQNSGGTLNTLANGVWFAIKVLG